jgi:hypothetical protein
VDKLAIEHPLLTKRAGSFHDAAAVDAAVAGQDAVIIAVNVADDVGDGVKEEVGVPLADAPEDRVVEGDAETVVEWLIVDDPLSLPDGVCVGVQELDAVPDPDGETVPVGVDEKVIVVEPVPEKEPVFEELAPSVMDAVGERETDRERLVVELDVEDAVPVPELVGVPVGDPLPVMLAVRLDVSEMLGVSLALAPKVTDGVAEFDNEALIVDEVEGVIDEVPVLDEVPDPVLVCDGVGGGVIVAVNVLDDEGDGVMDDDGVPLADAPADRVVVGVAETVVERLVVVDALSLPDGV